MVAAHREVETKYDVDDATALPDVSDLPDVARVEGPRTVRLEALYFDTDDLRLGRHGITLRRRTGGDDEGWHLKLPVAGARQEIHAPLGRGGRVPPLVLRRIVQGVVRDRPLRPVATVATERTTALLLDAHGTLLAEVCDDRVLAARAGPDGTAADEQRWREWEVEVHAARPRLTKAADARMRDAGARVAESGSKFGRVMSLGQVPGVPDRPPVRRHATEHELLARHVAALRFDLHRLDPQARADVPDAVHQTRVVLRRLRATLATFDKSFDTAVTKPVADDLRWLGEMLGRPRDLEVLQSRLGALVLSQPRELVRGRPGQWLDSRLRAARRAAYHDALEAMRSDRYFALVDALDSWQTRPPWADSRDRPADRRLPKALRREWAKVHRAVAEASVADDAERPTLLHDVRKASKRARYAAEALVPVVGPWARELARSAKTVQTILGSHHDTVVAGEQVLRLAAAARLEGRDTFTFGILTARLEAELSAQEEEFRRAWAEIEKGG